MPDNDATLTQGDIDFFAAISAQMSADATFNANTLMAMIEQDRDDAQTALVDLYEAVAHLHAVGVIRSASLDTVLERLSEPYHAAKDAIAFRSGR